MMRKTLFSGLFMMIFTVLVFSASAFGMEISAKYGNPETTVTLWAEPTDTVAILKETIATNYQIQPKSQVLSFNGVALDDNVALQDYGIKDGCVLQMRLKTNAMILGADDIYGAGVSYLYFGTYGGTPIYWRVLNHREDYDPTAYGEDNSLLLLSEFAFPQTSYDALGTVADTFYNTQFSVGEKTGIALTKSIDGSLSGQAIFPLSKEETLNSAYGFWENRLREARSLKDKNVSSSWWTRSLEPDGKITTVTKEGGYSFYNPQEPQGFRPAMNLLKDRVVFASAVQGGKTTEVKDGTALDSMVSTEEFNTKKWKLTLLDEENQTLTLGKITKNGNLVAIDYTNAPIGPKQYVSAIITDATGADILYYGKLQKTAANTGDYGTVKLTLPAGFFEENMQLKLFSERCNGDKYTDYAGVPQTVGVHRNNAKKLTGYSLQNQEGHAVINEARGSIQLTVAPDTDLRNLVAVFDLSADSGAYVDGVLQESGVTANDFSEPVVYTVVAEDDTSKNYTVTVNRSASSSDATLSSLILDGGEMTPPFSSGVYSYAAKVSGNTSKLKITAIPNDCRAKVSGNVGEVALEVGFNVFEINVTAEDGGILEYTLTVIREAPTPNPFIDVSEEKWFYQQVMDAYASGLLTGVTEDSFEPNTPMTRGMAMSILYRLDGEPQTTGEAKYNDVDSTSPYYSAIMWAERRQITTGYADGTFRPNETISREELCVFIHHYLSFKGRDNEKSSDLTFFSDGSDTSTWALKDVQWCVSNGYLEGYGDGTLKPQDFVLRSEAAGIFLKIK